jgi:AAA+ superfamily predicted ATPase
LCPVGAGTGKTLLARAVANRTDACFIRVIGSELVQKYVGEVRTGMASAPASCSIDATSSACFSKAAAVLLQQKKPLHAL